MDFFIVPLGLLYFLGFLYLSSPTTDFFIIPIHYLVLLSQRISLLFQASRGFFTFSLSQELFIVPVRQPIIYYASLKGFLHYSNPTGFFIIPLPKDSLSIRSDKK